uniref:Uncharacterized protein n=1 Tax=Rhizophora mucronata TaxID=61149 RepID=A0A2P2PSW2_RHIMU
MTCFCKCRVCRISWKGPSTIGIKRMGEKQSMQICSLWLQSHNNPQWHPFQETALRWKTSCTLLFHAA